MSAMNFEIPEDILDRLEKELHGGSRVTTFPHKDLYTLIEYINSLRADRWRLNTAIHYGELMTNNPDRGDGFPQGAFDQIICRENLDKRWSINLHLYAESTTPR